MIRFGQKKLKLKIVNYNLDQELTENDDGERFYACNNEKCEFYGVKRLDMDYFQN